MIANVNLHAMPAGSVTEGGDRGLLAAAAPAPCQAPSDASASTPSHTHDLGEARAAARISADYLLRTIRLLMDAHDGNVLDALIFQAIAQANVAHLRPAVDAAAGQALPGPPPDDQRRPVSILAVATGLGLPFETTRRHVKRMIADGRCARQGGGIIVPASALSSRRAGAAATANLANLRRCFRDLAKAGVDLG